MSKDKQKIIALFNKKVKGKQPNTEGSNAKHAGKEGHWLEQQMGIAQNASNSPDILGYEMKNDTTSKTTFGDWSADYYIFKDKDYKIDRDKFLTIFGKPNVNKGNRYSWSGEPCPNIHDYNTFGQIIKIDSKNNIVIEYNYNKDTRKNKVSVIPKSMKKNNLVLAVWHAESMKKKVEDKFNQKGWFKCLKNKENVYTNIAFGDPVDFENWIENVKNGNIFFDSGMYQGNIRNYSQWRANNSYWDSLITSKY